jgi:hypothetical protein
MERVSLLDQCETRYKELISLCNEMRDARIVQSFPILGKGRHVIMVHLALGPSP